MSIAASKNQLRYIIPPTEEKVLVLFIHGLNGRKKTWDIFAKKLHSTTQIKELYDVQYFVYPTYFFENIFKPLPNIQTIADGLKSHIDLNCSNYNKIILACHSMGGLIGRRYLLHHVKTMKQQQLKVKALLLYATPNNGSDLAKVNVFNPWHKQIKQLRKQSDFIDDLNEDWDIFKLKNLIDTTYIIAGRDAVVNRLSAKHFWGNQATVTNIDKSHIGVVRPLTDDDVSLKILISKIKSVFEIQNYEDSPEPPDEEVE